MSRGVNGIVPRGPWGSPDVQAAGLAPGRMFGRMFGLLSRGRLCKFCKFWGGLGLGLGLGLSLGLALSGCARLDEPRPHAAPTESRLYPPAERHVEEPQPSEVQPDTQSETRSSTPSSDSVGSVGSVP